MSLSTAEPGTVTLPFEKFWAWLQVHQNCIIRAGTPDVVLFDHDDYHWHLAQEDPKTLIVQVVRGKELVAEMVMITEDIAYVQGQAAEADAFVFECIIEGPQSRDVAYHFEIAHGYDEGAERPSRRWTH